MTTTNVPPTSLEQIIFELKRGGISYTSFENLAKRTVENEIQHRVLRPEDRQKKLTQFLRLFQMADLK